MSGPFLSLPIVAGIPQKRARFLFRVRNEKASQDDEQLAATQSHGVLSQQRYMEITGNKVVAALAGTENFTHVEEDDFVISLRTFEGGIERSNEAGCISPAYTVLAPSREVEPKFFHYLLKSQVFISHLQTTVTGIRDGKSVKFENFANILLPATDRLNQRKIADFLDRETGRIDLLIEKKQRLVELLGEKLKDDILRAVTLGVDPSVELVPEVELEWTSHRPMHWNVFRLKHFFRENTQYSGDGQETLFSLRMKEGLVPHNEVSDKEIPPSGLINYKKVFPGQIVMNRMRAAIGLFGLADGSGIVSPDYSVFDVHPNAHAGYFLRLFKTEPITAAFRLLSKGLGTGHSGFMRLNADNFGRIKVAVPEYGEQRLISEHVEARIQHITRLQAKNEQSIDRLKEYRSALITAAVTGQIDVETYAKSGTTDRRLDAIQEEMPVWPGYGL